MDRREEPHIIMHRGRGPHFVTDRLEEVGRDVCQWTQMHWRVQGLDSLRICHLVSIKMSPRPQNLVLLCLISLFIRKKCCVHSLSSPSLPLSGMTAKW